MNGFVDSPFLFFVDNVPPIFTENPAEDQRKIIEIIDVGCDAIIPIMASQNNSQYHPTRTTTLKNSRPRYDGKPANKLYRETWRPNEEVARNLGKPFSTSSKQVENVHRMNNDEHRWKKPTTHNDANDTTTLKNTPNTKPCPRQSPDRPKLNRWNKGIVQDPPQETHYDHAVPKTRKRPLSCPTQKRPATALNSKIDPKAEEPLTYAKRNTMVLPELDYPEDFNYSAPKSRHQTSKPSSPKTTKKPIEETQQQSQKSSKPQKPAKILGKSNNLEQSFDSRRIRSRTRSPPRDRQKRSRSRSKSSPKDLEQPEDPQNPGSTKNRASPPRDSDTDRTGSSTDDQSAEKIRRFVDRGVDRDSICDILKVSTSTDATLVPTSSIDTGNSEKIIGFWEFVPLDDESDRRRRFAGNRKTRCLLDHRMFQDNDYYPLRRDLVYNDDSSSQRSRIKQSIKRSLDLNQEKLEDRRSLDPGVPERIEGVPDWSSAASRPGQSARSVEVLHGRRQSSRTEMDGDVGGKKSRSNCEGVANEGYQEDSHDQSYGEPKCRAKIARGLGFGWPGKNRVVKRDSDGKRGEDEQRKKFENEGGLGGFIGKTAACLKRKLEGSQRDENVPKDSSLNAEKKIRSEANSKLPIRIGKRVKSKNPDACKVRETLKKEDESSELIGAVRSRTKPRIKPSVELHRIDVDPEGTPACPVEVNSVQAAEGLQDLVADGAIERGRHEQLGERLKYADLRRNEFANRFFVRGSQGNGIGVGNEVSRNSGFKEKCFFHVHDRESSICDKYCKEMRCEKVCQ